jgi:hypothetical protein
MFSLFFCPEDGSSAFGNNGKRMLNYILSHPRRIIPLNIILIIMDTFILCYWVSEFSFSVLIFQLIHARVHWKPLFVKFAVNR